MLLRYKRIYSPILSNGLPQHKKKTTRVWHESGCNGFILTLIISLNTGMLLLLNTPTRLNYWLTGFTFDIRSVCYIIYEVHLYWLPFIQSFNNPLNHPSTNTISRLLAEAKLRRLFWVEHVSLLRKDKFIP